MNKTSLGILAIAAFAAFPAAAHDELMKRHGDLFGPHFWREMQSLCRAGEQPDIFPYAPERRLEQLPG